MTVALISDHEEQALDLLLDQYRDRPRIRALLASYVRRCQELENAAWDVIVKRTLDNAADAQLDTLGKIVGATRDGLDDTDYRTIIRATIRARTSRGYADDLLTVTRLMLGDGVPFNYQELYPATALIQVSAVPVLTPALFRKLLTIAKPAGVRLDISYAATDGIDRTFVYGGLDADGNETTDDDLAGYGSVNDPDAGGQYGGYVY